MNMSARLSLIITAAALLLSGAAFADSDVAAKAEPCLVCHGAGGNVPIADYPKLAGQSRKYLLHTLRAYKSGARNNALMAAQITPLSDNDLQELAAYFAEQPGDLR